MSLLQGALVTSFEWPIGCEGRQREEQGRAVVLWAKVWFSNLAHNCYAQIVRRHTELSPLPSKIPVVVSSIAHEEVLEMLR